MTPPPPLSFRWLATYETLDVRLDVAVVVDMDAVGTVVDPVDDMLNEYICDSL